MSARGLLRIIEGGQLAFWCPGCKGAHALDARWKFNGNYNRPTFSPSVHIRTGHHCAHAKLPGDCHCDDPDPEMRCSICHSFVTDGSIQFLPDCTHEFAGKTVPLEAFTC